MKKALIAGAASAVLAAMPVVGVFATPADVQKVTDTINLTVTKTCKMQAEAAAKTIELGSGAAGSTLDGESESDGEAGSTITITCNGSSGWNLNAKPSALTSSTTSKNIPFGAFSDSGTSVWSAKAVIGNASENSNAQLGAGWGAFDGAKTISEGSTVAAQHATDTGNKPMAATLVTVTPYYKAYVDVNQPQGSYTGTIEYTFADLTPAQADPQP